MKLYGFDTETHLIKPGCVTPKMVCLTWYTRDHQGIFLRDEGLAWLREKLLDPEAHLVGQYAFFDLGVACAEDDTFIPLVFDAIDQGRIHDTPLRQQVIDNAEGKLKYQWDEEKEKMVGSKYDLASLVYRHFKVNIFAKKEGADIWRLRYNELDGVPLAKWPPAAVEYAIEDAMWAYEIWQSQEEHLSHEEGGLPHQARLVGAAWALYLAAAWGFRTDREYTLRLEAQLNEELAYWRAIAQECGRFIRKGNKQSKNLDKIRKAVEALVERPALTPKGKTATTREQLADVPCPACGKGFLAHNEDGFTPCETESFEHIGLWAVSEVTRVEKKLTTYVKVLKRGFDTPINCRYNSILETFRTSCSGPNIQNYPRQGNIRDCVVPRPGWEFGFCDLDTIEMRTLAQTCIDLFGFSDIAEAIKAGEDLHISLIAPMRGETYEECYNKYKAGDKEIDFERTLGKVGNYGLAGGMASETLVEYAKSGYNIEISLETAEKLHQGFRTRWREMPLYFQDRKDMVGGSGKIQCQVFNRSGLLRGRVSYTAACNGDFQHLAAMGAKDGLYQATKECYDPRLKSPLYGCRPWLFAHDEIGIEIPTHIIGREGAAAAIRRLEEVMIEAMKFWCPDVPIGATGVLCKRWRKGAKPVEHEGLIVPSRPVKDGKRVVWVPDLEMAA